MSKQGGAARASDRPHNLSVAPPEVRCEFMIPEPDGGSHRCSRWFLAAPDGTTDRMCITHSETSYVRGLRSKGRKEQQATFGRAAAAKRKLLEELVPARFSSFSEIGETRNRVMRAVALEDISASAGAVLLRALDKATEHMRELGEPRALEGGSGYLRLLPGVQIVEYLTDANRPITPQEMQLIYEKQEEDRRAGRPIPVTWQECILLYLGIRRDPEVAYDDATHEPVGEYRCEVFVNPGTNERRVRRMFVPYTRAQAAAHASTAEGKAVAARRRRR